jgi:membrane protease YdiL (CAAX protease family)
MSSHPHGSGSSSCIVGVVSGRSLVVFFVLTYALTWTTFITVARAVPANTPAGYALVLLGAFAPAIVALGLTARDAGAAGVRALAARIGIVGVAARWYGFALVYMIAIKLAAALIHRGLLGAWPRFGSEPLYVIPIAIAISTPFQAGEEIGWRGYALPRLAARYGVARASLLLGAVWACWHIPQFYIAGADTYHQSFVVWAPQVVALSVALAWLYSRTRGSLFLVMLLHSAINNSKDIVPSGMVPAPGVFSVHVSAISWLTLALLWICSAWFLARMPAKGSRDLAPILNDAGIDAGSL